VLDGSYIPSHQASLRTPQINAAGSLKNKNLFSLEAVSLIIKGFFANIQKNTMRTYKAFC
jgi:hypothetical protein